MSYKLDRIRPLLEDMAEVLGIPPSTVATICSVESGFDPLAENPRSRAAGLFQFIPVVAKEYGLVYPFNPRDNCRAATHLFEDNRKRLARRGIPFNLLTAYLAHQQGAKGCAEIYECALYGEPLKLARYRNMQANLPGSVRAAFEEEAADPTKAQIFLHWWYKRLKRELRKVEAYLAEN